MKHRDELMNEEEYIEKLWNGEIRKDFIDICDFCKYDTEDEDYLRYCTKLDFSSFGTSIKDCIDFKRK